MGLRWLAAIITALFLFIVGGALITYILSTALSGFALWFLSNTLAALVTLSAVFIILRGIKN